VKKSGYGKKCNAPEMEAGGSIYNLGDWRYRLFSFDMKIKKVGKIGR
jgi:hypothetical protein